MLNFNKLLSIFLFLLTMVITVGVATANVASANESIIANPDAVVAGEKVNTIDASATANLENQDDSNPGSYQPENLNSPQTVEGEVLAIKESGTKYVFEELVDYQILEVELTKGEGEGELVAVENTAAIGSSVNLSYQAYQPGDLLRLSVIPTVDGSEQYIIAGKIKRQGLLLLAGIFLVAVLMVGRVWGALSLVGMGASFLVIFQVIIPGIINGMHPVQAAILGSLLIIPTTFYISHGFNVKTHVGVISTLLALVFTGLLATYFVQATHLTGYASEEAGFLQVERQGSIDIRGLLLAGIIIGTLGILDDVTIGQASVVQQIKRAKPDIKLWPLFKQGMNVGQDHISSMVNTLVLVYSGSALPLLLLFYGHEQSFWQVFEFELIAEEVVRMLVGSIGLVLVAPVATWLAAFLFTKYGVSELKENNH